MLTTTNLLVTTLKAHLAGQLRPVPEPCRLVWGWFLDLCHTRTASGIGPNPITYAEIEAYARVKRWPLEPRHVDAIKELDRVWLDHARAELGKDSTPSKTPTSAAPVLSAAAFDAIFGNE